MCSQSTALFYFIIVNVARLGLGRSEVNHFVKALCFGDISLLVIYIFLHMCILIYYLLFIIIILMKLFFGFFFLKIIPSLRRIGG